MPNNDLISRAAAIDELKKMVEHHSVHDAFRGELLHYTGIKAMLECLPAVDAAPVVRCKIARIGIIPQKGAMLVDGASAKNSNSARRLTGSALTANDPTSPPAARTTARSGAKTMNKWCERIMCVAMLIACVALLLAVCGMWYCALNGTQFGW